MWRNASNWGFLSGIGLFAVNLVGWGLKLETAAPLVYELLLFVALCVLIIVSGRRNADSAGEAGYGYGTAIGFVLAMMMCAGVVYGVGKFLLINFFAPEYYGVLNEKVLDIAFGFYKNLPQYEHLVEMRPRMLIWLRNPFYLIFQSALELVFKGGFLGLVLCAFVIKKPASVKNG